MIQPDSSSFNDMQIGQPTWRMALLFPPQGSWSEQEYLALDAGRQIEFDHGCVEVLDLPIKEHQRLVRLLFRLIDSFVVSRQLGEVFFAPLPVRLWTEKYREPDLVFLSQSRSDSSPYANGADLLLEVVSESPSDRKRDLETKVSEYEQARIPEYWVVDPLQSVVLIYRLVDSKYVKETFMAGQIAPSSILDGFSVEVASIFERS
jgi:Uma2 family endonuclease